MACRNSASNAILVLIMCASLTPLCAAQNGYGDQEVSGETLYRESGVSEEQEELLVAQQLPDKGLVLTSADNRNANSRGASDSNHARSREKTSSKERRKPTQSYEKDALPGDADENRVSKRRSVQSTQVEEVVVTGTHISGESVTPIMVFSQLDFEVAGSLTAQEFLATIPQNFGGGHTEDTLGQPGRGPNPSLGVGVNLRGLGPSSTLVLINGRRPALSGAAEFADISMLPMSAIDRIEVLPDGASAIYGSDAIGGVVNFITKRSYTGAETRLQIGSTTRGDGEIVHFAQSAGKAWETGSLVTNYEYYDRAPINSLDRHFSRNALGPYDLISGQKKHGIYTSLRQDFARRFQFDADMLYGDRKSNYKSYEVGADRVIQLSASSDQFSVSTGLGFQLTESWILDLSTSVSRNTADVLRYQPSSVIRSTSEYTLTSGDAKVSADLFEVNGHVVSAVLGAGYRSDSYESSSTGSKSSLSTKSAYGELRIPLLNGQDGDAVTNKRLIVSIAGRYEESNAYGAAFNPKFAIKWVPHELLGLRATYGKSFKAPSVYQLNEFNAVNAIVTQNLPTGSVRAIARLGNNASLVAETADTWTAGLDLNSEGVAWKAQLNYFDIRYQDRIQGISVNNAALLTVPYYESLVLLRGEIPDTEFDSIVADLLTGGTRTIVGCPAMYSVSGSCSEPVTNFTAVLDRRLSNLARTRVRGLDVLFSSNHDLQWAAITFQLNASYLLNHAQQITVTAPLVDFVDRVNNPVDFRMRASVTARKGNWNLTLTANYTDQYSTEGTISPVTGMPRPITDVPSWTTLDVSTAYQLLRGASGSRLYDDTRIAVTLINILDADPPYLGDDFQRLGYDPANADPIGRSVSLALTKQW